METEITEFKKYADIFIIICIVDAQIAAKRHLKRGLDDPKREFYHGDNRVTHFKKTGEFLPAGKWEPPSINAPTMKVSTLKGYRPGLKSIRKCITKNH